MENGKISHRDYAGAKAGMWIFLLTEVFFFSGPLILYAIFRFRHPGQFRSGSSEMDLLIGTINTVILITSSFFVASAVSAVKKGRKSLAVALLLASAAIGAVFLYNKYIEWYEKITHGLYPNSRVLLDGDPGRALFYSLYYFLTGLHGLHVLAGIIVLLVMAAFVQRGSVNRDDYIKLENSGLYWHLVDLIWIYLFPFFYLVS